MAIPTRVLGVFAALLFATSAAFSQSFPSKPITLVCPFTPGAAADLQLRALAQAMSSLLGQNVLVDNRPGAAGTIGPSIVAKAPRDGYMLAQVTNTLIRQPFIIPATPYDPINDFTYIIAVSTFEFGLVVDSKSPWKNFGELTAHAKRNPNKISYGTIGIGSVPHQIMSRIGEKLDISWTHVPYKGSSPAQIDLQGGSIEVLADTTGWTPLVDAGKVRLLAVFGEQRLKRFPRVPTLKELGLNIADAAPWGIAGPKEMPPAVVKLLHDTIRKAMADPKFQEALDLMANEVRYMSTAEYQNYMKARQAIEKEVVEKYGLRER
jgi:tripartite-type tricarboxylate transporter receptor subunit TctC